MGGLNSPLYSKNHANNVVFEDLSHLILHSTNLSTSNAFFQWFSAKKKWWSAIYISLK